MSAKLAQEFVLLPNEDTFESGTIQKTYSWDKNILKLILQFQMFNFSLDSPL